GLPISGSNTLRSASRTWASVTIASFRGLIWLTRCAPWKSIIRRGWTDARTGTDRGLQGARRRYALSALPVPAPLGPARVDPRALDASVAASEHAPAAPASPGGGGPRRERGPPGGDGRASPGDVHGGRP